MTVNERLADYRHQPITTVADPRWEAIIIDMRAGWVWLQPEQRAGMWRIKVRNAKETLDCLNGWAFRGGAG